MDEFLRTAIQYTGKSKEKTNMQINDLELLKRNIRIGKYKLAKGKTFIFIRETCFVCVTAQKAFVSFIGSRHILHWGVEKHVSLTFKKTFTKSRGIFLVSIRNNFELELTKYNVVIMYKLQIFLLIAISYLEIHNK